MYKNLRGNTRQQPWGPVYSAHGLQGCDTGESSSTLSRMKLRTRRRLHTWDILLWTCQYQKVLTRVYPFPLLPQDAWKGGLISRPRQSHYENQIIKKKEYSKRKVHVDAWLKREKTLYCFPLTGLSTLLSLGSLRHSLVAGVSSLSQSLYQRQRHLFIVSAGNTVFSGQ